MRTWVVVAAYNEQRRLARTLSDLCAVCPNVVVVDDGSGDGTERVALEHPVWVLRHVINCGQGAALQTGIDFAVQHVRRSGRHLRRRWTALRRRDRPYGAAGAGWPR